MFKNFTKAVQDEVVDPEARAAAKQAAGGTLIADGLVGLENPFDGKKTRVGIFGTFALMAFGLVFVAAGFFVRSTVSADSGDIIVTGTVVDIDTSRGDNGTLYAPVVEYTDPATGQSYFATSNLSTSSRPRIGEARDVAFPPDIPGAGRVLGGAWYAWIFIGVGALVLLSGMFTFVKRLAAIVFGTKLLLDGRNESAAMGSESGVVETLADSVSDIYSATS